LTPIPVDGRKVFAWRLDREEFAKSWASGIGAAAGGGRWNLPARRIVYASLDPATTVLEKAVHAGFTMLDTIPHVLTKFVIHDIDYIDVVDPTMIANPNWLRPGAPNSNQQAFLQTRLANAAKPFVLVPSVISPQSWNVIFDPKVARGKFRMIRHNRFALDQRLSP
jgi:RES domain-containing protein